MAGSSAAEFTDLTDKPESRALISSVRVFRSPAHWEFHIWNRGGKAGVLTVDEKDGQALLDRLIPPEYRNTVLDEKEGLRR